MFDLLVHLRRQRLWSRQTFGPGKRTGGVIAHIRKELAEIEKAPCDLTEWIDVLLLAFDGAMRAGYTPEMVCAALDAKLMVNEARQWPDWRKFDENAPIEHVHKPHEKRIPVVTKRACDHGCRHYKSLAGKHLKQLHPEGICTHPVTSKDDGGWLPLISMHQRGWCAPPDLTLWEMRVNAKTEEGELING
jgi:hypothetical protein